jgi:thiamine biosynthesis lipoprotein
LKKVLLLFLFLTVGLSAEEEPGSKSFFIAKENVLGTSLDITLVTQSQKEATLFETRFFTELNRLTAIYSTYDPKSEVSKLNDLPLQKEILISREMYYFLKNARLINIRSENAFNIFTEELMQLWKKAVKENKLPASSEIEKFKKMPLGFEIRRRKKEGTYSYSYFFKKVREGKFNLNALAKGEIIDGALEVALKEVKCLGALVNIGGDLRAEGHQNENKNGWLIEVADPKNPADNAKALSKIRIRNKAVATSAGYARPQLIEGKKYSHILNPNTGVPAEHVSSATVVYKYAVTADALSTALCVLPVKKGLALANRYKAACLIVDKTGKEFRNRYWQDIEVSTKTLKNQNANWGKGYSVKVEFELLRTPSRKFHRHYVAAWVSDEKGKRVKVLALWYKKGKDKKYLKDLKTFWKEAYSKTKDYGHLENFATVTRATRPVGRYSLYWDGRNDEGEFVPKGSYTIHLDINREKGPNKERHSHASGKLNCSGDKKDSVNPKNIGELGQMNFSYEKH